MTTLQDLDQALAQLEQTILAIRDSAQSYITRYNQQTRTCTQLLDGYSNLVRTGQISSNVHAQRKTQIDECFNNIGQWADLEENNLMHQFDSTYPTQHGEPIKINLGKLEFRSPVHQPETEYAVKFSSIRKQTNLEDPVREAWFCNFTGKDSHKRMLPLTLACTLRNTFIMITPKALGTDLFKYITAKPEEAKRNAKAIFSELCYALDYLHNHLGVAHLDLKPENVFLDEHAMPILGDFGMAQSGSFPQHPHNTPQGHKFYFARHITNQIRTIVQSQCIDDAPLTVLPRFSLSLPDFQKFQNQPNITVNLAQLIDSISIGHIRDVPLPQPPAAAAATPAAGAPAQPASTTMGEEVTPSTQPPPPLQVPPEQTFTFGEYLHFIGQQEAKQSGMNVDDYWAHFDPSRIPREQFFDYVMQNYITPLHPTIQSACVLIHLLPDLPTHLYSQLSPDLATLAVRPVSTTLGTRAYMAPEVFANNPGYDAAKADIYSLGVVFFILVFGFPPYRNSYLDRRHAEYDQAYARLHVHYTDPPPPPNGRNQGVTKLVQDYGKQGQVHVTVTNLLDRMMDFNFRTRVSLKRIINEFLPTLQL